MANLAQSIALAVLALAASRASADITHVNFTGTSNLGPVLGSIDIRTVSIADKATGTFLLNGNFSNRDEWSVTTPLGDIYPYDISDGYGSKVTFAGGILTGVELYFYDETVQGEFPNEIYTGIGLSLISSKNQLIRYDVKYADVFHPISESNTFGTFKLDVPTGVPEPATWGLMLGGFGAVGLAMRRRALVAA